MTDVRIDPARWAAQMDRLADRFVPTVLRGVRAGAARCILLMEQRTMSAPPASPRGTVGAFNTGGYMRSWRSEGLSFGARVYNLQPYSGVVDLGRRPGVGVSRQGIELGLMPWAKRKLGLTDSQARSVAWAIATAIKKRGLLPRRVMTGGLDAMERLVVEEVEHELDAELSR